MRDRGTREAERQRIRLINGSNDHSLAASCSGILYANAVIQEKHHSAAIAYARLHAVIFRRGMANICLLSRHLPWQGTPPDEASHEGCGRKLAKINGLLTDEQRQAVADVACYDRLPSWWLAAKHRWRPLPEDARDQAALIDGLEVIATFYGFK